MNLTDLLLIFLAKYLIVTPFLVLLFYFLFAPRRIRHRLAWLTVVSMPVAYMIARIAGHLYYNARPFVVDGFTPIVAHAADNGFPSDHTLLAATIAGLIWQFNKKVGAVLWAVAALIAFARVAIGVHHAIDTIASMLIALVAVFIGHYVVRRIRREKTQYISE